MSDQLIFDQLRAGLEQVRATLEDLTVRTQDSTEEIHPRVTASTGILGSLRSLSALKSLTTPFTMIYRQQQALEFSEYFELSEILPDQLEQLTITDDLWNLEIVAFLGLCKATGRFYRAV